MIIKKILFLTIICLIPNTIVYGAELYIQSENTKNTIGIGESFEVKVLVFVQDEIINTIEGFIEYPVDILELETIKDGNSIIPLWVQKPKNIDNTIIFSGMIPGGFNGVIEALTFPDILPGEIFTLQFKTKKQGVANIVIKDSNILLHDGLGTSAIVDKKDFKVMVENYFNEQRVETIDIERPIIIDAYIVREKDLFEGNRTLIFQIADKQTGIDFVEIKESGMDWIKVESPYKLQKKYGSVELRVFDKNQNQTNIIIEDIKNPWNVYILLSLFLVSVLYLYIKRKNKVFK